MKNRWIPALTAVSLMVLLAAAVPTPAEELYRERVFYRDTRTENEEPLNRYAQEQWAFYSRYPQSIIELLGRNPETAEFVMNYPDPPPEAASLSGIPRDTVPLLLQWDTRWGYAEYGSDVLGITGCGPTCLAMIAYYLTGDETLTPAAVARFSEAKGYYASGRGSTWSLFSEGGPALGLTVAELPLNGEKMTQALAAGHPLVLNVGPGDFTSGGHYIVVAGAEPEGFRVNDPNSRIRSRKLWRFEEIKDQIRNAWEFSYDS